MCGIAGYLQPGGFSSEHANSVSRAMAAALAHRGPDDDGVWLDGSSGVALAHRRLAVVDLSAAGHQPMQSESGRYVIVFNGEIYNHAEIRLRLERDHGRAIAWRGNSDTESLLAAIERFGVVAALQEAVGMFALALWDRRERILYLARDRLGEKPLYYGWQNGVFMFGSELKALVRHPRFRGEIDRGALALFLRHMYVPSPWSIYQGIRKLAPGTYLRLRPDVECPGVGSVREPERYWSLEDAVARGRERPFEGDADDAVQALQHVLSEAVAAQLVADVPLGAFLSGGIDSSTIVALMQERSSRPVKTFTIGFDDPQYDEAAQAKEVARYLRTDHTEWYVTPRDAMDVIPRLPALYDEPFADSSQIPTALVAAMTRRHVTVALSGDGGDEMFGGYQRYFRMRTLWRVLSSVPAPLRRFSAFTVSGVPSSWSAMRLFDKARKLGEIVDCRGPEQLYHRLVSHWKEPTAIVRQAAEPRTRLSDRLMWPPRAYDLESRMMAVDAQTYLPDDILVKVDRAAMGVSLETRAPFLDHRVVELAWRLPSSVKIRHGAGKWVLKRLLHGHVPQQLVERPKMGFGVPLATWLRGPLRDWAESLLDGSRLRAEGFLRPGPIRQRWTEHVKGHGQWAAYLWDVLMFQAWLHEARRGGNGNGG